MRPLLLVLAATALAACDATADDPCVLAEPQARSVVACVTGDVEVTLSATADLFAVEDPGEPVGLTVVEALGRAEGGDRAGLTVALYTDVGETLAAATYPISLDGLETGATPPGTAFVSFSVAPSALPENPRTFTATSGTVTVEGVGGGAVTGRLRVEAEDTGGSVTVEARFRVDG